MKLKKMLAFCASLGLVTSFASFPVFAENHSNMVVVGISKDNSSYTLRSCGDYTVDRETIEKYNSSIGELHLGDIVSVGGLNWDFLDEPVPYDPFEPQPPHLWFAPWISLFDIADEDALSFSVIGSVFDNPETRTYQVTGRSTTYWRPKSADVSNKIVICVLNDGVNDIHGNHGWAFQFDGDIDDYIYTTSDCVDWATLQKGDIVSCIVYDNVPMFVIENSSATPSGDADGNGTLDILDVISVNKAVLGKEDLDPERIPHVDFNSNGVPDSDDALTMLKKIVGLA